MLKISIQETEGSKVALLLAGRIANSEVEQLRSYCRQVLESGGKLSLDLTGVSFIDRNGVALIHALEDQQVRLVNASPFVTEQLKRKKNTPVAGGVKPKKEKGKPGDEQR